MNRLLPGPCISHRRGAFAPLLVFLCLSCSSSPSATTPLMEPDGGGSIDAASDAAAPTDTTTSTDAAASADTGVSSEAGSSTDGGGSQENVTITDDGPVRCDSTTLAEGAVCPTKKLGTKAIVGPTFRGGGANVVFGDAPD